LGYEFDIKRLVKLPLEVVGALSTMILFVLNLPSVEIHDPGVSMRSRISVLQFYRLMLTLSFTTFAFGVQAEQPTQFQEGVPFDRFDLLDEVSGWVLIDQHLFWTSDMGYSWVEIGPSIPENALIQDVEIIDSDTDTGWILWSLTNPDGSSSFQLAHTSDHGRKWVIQSLSLFESGELASFAEKAEMGWLDIQTGWVSVKQLTGPNFSIGTLFMTSDGGVTWSRARLPVAEHVYFNDPQVGWAVGGPTHDQIFKTQDVGKTWHSVGFDTLPENTVINASMLSYSNGHGLLVTTNLGIENSLGVYSLENSSGKWLTVNRIRLDAEPGVIGLSIIDPQKFVATIPGTRSILRMTDGELNTFDNKDGFSASIVELDMISLEIGWGKSVDAGCVTTSTRENQVDSVSCSTNTRLFRTMDGGATWQNVNLPSIQRDTTVQGFLSPNRTAKINSLPNLGNTQIFIGQGFDKCEIPTLSQLQTWSSTSPYKAVNLYIGGSSRACDNNALTQSYLNQVYHQGWKFIPTWLGPQAPCTNYVSRMSNDVTIAYNQGVAEANLAVERLATLGLTSPDKTGSVVYYDIEHYGTNLDCRSAVNSFMNGWVSQIHAHGNLAGVYSSTVCDTGISDFRFIMNVPDVIWPARWFHNSGSGYYDPSASVWDLGSCLPDDVWADHQRIRQYEGGHNETWGNLTLEIDSNVLDGVVAIPYGFPVVNAITRIDPDPTNVTIVDFRLIFSESITGLTSDDFKLTTTGVTGAAVNHISGSGNIYTVAVDTGSGNGTIRLDMVDNDSIKGETGEPLGGLGSGTGDYTSGELYTIIKNVTFIDVAPYYWAWDFVERLYAAGVTGGCSMSPLQYCPERIVSRAQMAVFLERGIHGSAYTPPAVGGNTGFSDVSTSYWAAAWIKQLAAESITGGCGSGIYCPENPINRAQMAVFLLRAKHGAGYTPPAVGDSTGFGDVSTSYWAAAWIKQLVIEGITAGCGSGNYCPEMPVTRAQMAVFLVRTFNLP